MAISLVFDTETTGLVKNRLPPEHPSQPRLVQIAMAQLDDDHNVIQKVSMIVKPDNFTIPKEASDIHGITQEKAEKYGLPIKTILSVFNQMCLQSSELIAHNLPFDELVMKVESFRNNVTDRTQTMNKFCTMEASRDLLAIPPTAKMVAAGIMEYKSPRLEEAYKHFTGKDLVGAHDALVDVMATIEVLTNIRPPNSKNINITSSPAP